MSSSVSFKRLTAKEEIQLALYGVHANAQREDERKRAENKADVAVRWRHTHEFIKSLQKRMNDGEYPLIAVS